jgi:hypothetical protein
LWAEKGQWMGIEGQPSGRPRVVLVGPVLIYALRLQVADGARALILELQQRVYRFERQ